MRQLRPSLLAAAVLTVLAVPPALADQGSGFERLFRFQDPRITESSGLVARTGTMLTVNDSGDGPYVYVVDDRTGETVGVTTYSPDPVTDVEAIAPGRDGTVWVGDIGDNAAVRDHVSVYRLDPVTPGDRTVAATRYDLAYPRGARDAESLLVDPVTGRLLVISKGLFGGAVYEAPTELRPDRVNRLRQVGGVAGLVTDAAFLPGGRYAVVRTYADSVLYDTRDWSAVAEVPLPDQEQGEAVAVRPDGTSLAVSSEGEHAPVYAVALPPAPLRVLAGNGDGAATPTPTPGGDATPSADPAQPQQGSDVSRVLPLAAVVLAAALGVRVLFRRRARRAS